jgi:hypothetical protein
VCAAVVIAGLHVCALARARSVPDETDAPRNRALVASGVQSRQRVAAAILS